MQANLSASSLPPAGWHQSIKSMTTPESSGALNQPNMLYLRIIEEHYSATWMQTKNAYKRVRMQL